MVSCLLAQHGSRTPSRRILDVLKSRYITGFSASSWRKARPFAASRAIFILMDQGRGKDPAAKKKKKRITEKSNVKKIYNSRSWFGQQGASVGKSK